MMFATLDDLEGRVEMIIFAKSLEKLGDTIEADAVLLVRGRVDHKERGETKLSSRRRSSSSPAHDEVAAAREKARSGRARAKSPWSSTRRASARRSSTSSSPSSATSPARPRCCW